MSFDVKKARRLILIYMIPLTVCYSLITLFLVKEFPQNQEWIFVISTFVCLVISAVLGKVIRAKARL